MKTTRLVTLLALVLSLSIAAGAWAVDDGQTTLRLSKRSLSSPSTSVDIIPLTSGSGNVKGVLCAVTGTIEAVTNLQFFVDGGAAQTFFLSEWVSHFDANGDRIKEIPMNVRFETSIRVHLQRGLGGSFPASVTCAVSWGLD